MENQDNRICGALIYRVHELRHKLKIYEKELIKHQDDYKTLDFIKTSVIENDILNDFEELAAVLGYDREDDEDEEDMKDWNSDVPIC